MGKKVTVEMCCDRCSAVWFNDFVTGKPLPETPSIDISMILVVDGESTTREVAFEVLCEKCMQVVNNYLDSIDRDPEARKGPKTKKDKVESPADKPVAKSVAKEGVEASVSRPPKPPTQPANFSGKAVRSS